MKPFKYETQDLNDINTPFYARIGLLSVRFSEIESLINHIIEKLINPQDEMVSYLLIEPNGLDKNLLLLDKLNAYRDFQEEKMSKIVSEVRLLKNLRNFFIHGVWTDVKSENDENYICCVNHKWVSGKDSLGQYSTRYKNQKFTLESLNLEIEKADEILLGLKKIWEDLQEVDFFL